MTHERRNSFNYVVWARILLVFRTNECQVLNSFNIGGIRTMQIAIRIVLIVQRNQDPGLLHFFDKFVILVVAAGAPMDAVRISECCYGIDPILQG